MAYSFARAACLCIPYSPAFARRSLRRKADSTSPGVDDQTTPTSAEADAGDPTASVVARVASTTVNETSTHSCISSNGTLIAIYLATKPTELTLLARALVTREAFLQTIDQLGDQFATGAARDQLILDLLDYRRAEVEGQRTTPPDVPLVVELPEVRLAFTETDSTPEGILVARLGLRRQPRRGRTLRRPSSCYPRWRPRSQFPQRRCPWPPIRPS